MRSIILASQSPRRKELLSKLGFNIQCKPAHIDEQVFHYESAEQAIKRLALEKAQVIAKEFPQELVLGADTCVVVDGEAWGKPEDFSHFQTMMQRLSGQWHEVITAVAVIGPEKTIVEADTTRVKFTVVSPEEIEQYWATGEPCDKAGGYGIQGYASLFIERIEGSYSGVMGLPLELVNQLLKKQQYDFWQERK